VARLSDSSDEGPRRGPALRSPPRGVVPSGPSERDLESQLGLAAASGVTEEDADIDDEGVFGLQVSTQSGHEGGDSQMFPGSDLF
jgi:hypothetical protein